MRFVRRWGRSLVISSSKKRGYISLKLYSDGKWIDSLYVDGGPSLNQKVGKIRMVGQDIFKHAVKKLRTNCASLSKCNLLQRHKLVYSSSS